MLGVPLDITVRERYGPVNPGTRLYVVEWGDPDRVIDPDDVIATEQTVQLYSDRGLTNPIGQPVLADDDGQYPYYVAPGMYQRYSPDDSFKPIQPLNAGSSLGDRYDLGSETTRQLVSPALERVNGGNPILKGAAEATSPGESIFWLSILHTTTPGVLGPNGLLENYIVYYSPDHSTVAEADTGGIFAATCQWIGEPLRKRNADKSLVGGTGAYDGPNGTPVYKHDEDSPLDGTQTETPSVTVAYDDPDGRPVYLFFHTWKSSGQRTMLATSADGWPPFVFEPEKLVQVGNPLTGVISMYGTAEFEQTAGSHTGYFQIVDEVSGLIAAISTMGGGKRAGGLVHLSHDKRIWLTDYRPLRNQADVIANNLVMKARLNTGGMIRWNGRLLHIGNTIKIGDLGGDVPRELISAPASSDYRHLTGVPQKLLTMDGATESDDVRSVATFGDIDREIYVAYVNMLDDDTQCAHIARVVPAGEGDEVPEALTPNEPRPLRDAISGLAIPRARSRALIAEHAQEEQTTLEAPWTLRKGGAGTPLIEFNKMSGSTRGYVQCTTGAVDQSKIEVYGPPLHTTQFQAIYFTVEGLRYDLNQGEFDLQICSLSLNNGVGNDEADAGGAIFAPAATPAAANLNFATGAGPTTYLLESFSLRCAEKRNVTFVLYPDEKAMRLYSDDEQEIAYVSDVADWNDGLVYPRLKVITQEDAPHWFAFSRLLLEGVRN